MSIINSQPRIGAAGQSTGQYKIERSLRFNSADSAYLNRTPASAGNRRTWTWSGWIKRGLVDTNYRSFFSNGNAVDSVMFWNDTSLAVRNFNGTSYDVRTTQLFRDPSAWYHLVIAMDTTQATASNRIKIYVNGVQVTAFALATYPSPNYDTGFNTTTVQYLGYNEYNYFDGYMTEVNFLDGSTPTTTTRTVSGVTETILTQFGEFDTDTGVWKPKSYSGSYGTNGFYLKFADNSGTTSTTLGKDSSGNGNNWTPNNFYVGPGTTNAEKAGIDSLVDTPTPYGTDTGAGGEVRGNYCTLNSASPLATAVKNGGLQLDYNATNCAPGTIGVTTGKWYWEGLLTTQIDNQQYFGVANASFDLSKTVGEDANSWGMTVQSNSSNGKAQHNNVQSSSYATFANGDICMVAYDMGTGKIWFGRNGTWFNSGAPASGTGEIYSNLSGTIVPMLCNDINSGGVLQVNFGQRPFAYTAPSGFKALCTQNLPTPTIGATATTRADDYFNTVLYTGNGSTQTISGVGFQPDFVWCKSRSNAYWHTLMDAVRGRACMLFSNTTGAEYSTSPSDKELTAFTSDGFSLGPDLNYSINSNGATFVAWNWKANGAGSSNTAGTITSTVSANTTAGFSIVTYTAAGANSTVGHGLGVAPSMIIIKRRDSTGGWGTYHSAIGNTKYLTLNLTDAATTDSVYWNNTSPTSTVFSLGTLWANTATYVAYCFAQVAGYSAFGSYTGNGSADGPFVYTGFMPRYIMIKRTDTNGTSWVIFDTARNLFNSSGKALWADLSDAEATYTDFDILSNGFKLRFTSSTGNASGGTYVYAAFAEVPTKFSLAR